MTDFRDPATLALARSQADRILESTGDPAELWAMEQASAGDQATKLTQLAIKLARSRALFLTTPNPVFVSVIVPAYGENVRLLPRGSGPGADPNGEDFVIQKSAQAEWLFAGTTSGYEIIVVDDMSKVEPVTSGEAIARVVAEHSVPHFRVLSLTEGVNTEKSGAGLVSAALRNVEIPKNTRKAGAV